MPGSAELPPPAVHSGVSPTGYQRCGGNGMFQPKRVGRGRSVSWPATATPLHPLGASLLRCLSPPQPGIPHPRCWDGSRCGNAAARLSAGEGSVLVTAELVNTLHHCRKTPDFGTTSALQIAARATWGESRPGWSQACSVGLGSVAAGFEDDERLMHLFFCFLGPKSCSRQRQCRQIVICNHFWQHHEQSSAPGLQLRATWGSVMLLPAPEPG